MSTTTSLMTVDQFRELRDPPGAYYELRHGQAVAVTRPKWTHFSIQHKLRKLLEGRAHPADVVELEFAFRPLPDYELWAADVAYVRRDRLAVEGNDNFRGAPDLVVEVLSPSNTAEEMEDRKTICLENGAIEFWIISPKSQTITVYTSETHTVYKAGNAVPVVRFFPDEQPISVDAVFTTLS